MLTIIRQVRLDDISRNTKKKSFFTIVNLIKHYLYDLMTKIEQTFCVIQYIKVILHFENARQAI